MDYRNLCLELFGTDDVNELTRIAQTYTLKNPRKSRTEEEIYRRGRSDNPDPD